MLEEKITEILAGVADGRLYWVRAPQGMQRPYVVLHRIGGIPNYQFCGRGTTESRIQANCTADTYAEAKALARDVIAALDMYSDPASGILGIFMDSDGRDLPTEDSGKVNYLFTVAVDLTVHHH